MIALVCAAALLWQTGCSQQCAQVRQDYQQALAQEAQLGQAEQLSAGAPTHMGVALRYDLLAEVAQRVLGRALDESLRLDLSIPIGGGKSVKVNLRGEALDLRFEPDPACEECFRLMGDLGGDATVNLPVLGERKVPLDGSMGLVMPVLMKAQEDGSVTVKLDLSKLADYTATFLTMEAEQLPEAIGRALKQPMSQRVLQKLSASLEPVDVFTFRPPTLGLEGLRVLPSQIKLVPKQRAIFVGFTTNLPGVDPGQGLDPNQAMRFGEQENVAVAVQPGVLVHVVSLLMQSEAIPRRYTMQGQASGQGPAHVTMREVAVGELGEAVAAQEQVTPKREPLNVAFRVWNLLGQGGQADPTSQGPCFWFDALVTGDVTLEQQKLVVDLEQIELQDASVAPGLVQALAQWKSAQFLDETKRLIERTLTEPRIELPVGQLILAPSSLARDPNTLALRSRVAFEMPKRPVSPSGVTAPRGPTGTGRSRRTRRSGSPGTRSGPRAPDPRARTRR